MRKCLLLQLGDQGLTMRPTQVLGNSQLYSKHRATCALRAKEDHVSEVFNHKDTVAKNLFFQG